MFSGILSLSEEDKERVREELREVHMDRQRTKVRHVSKAVDGRLERLESRLQSRADKLEDRGFGRASDRLRMAADNVQDARERFRANANVVEEN